MRGRTPLPHHNESYAMTDDRPQYPTPSIAAPTTEQRYEATVEAARCAELDPGPYSVLVLHDSGEWAHPTYLVGPGTTEDELRRLIEADPRASVTATLQVERDDECEEGDLLPLPATIVSRDTRPPGFAPLEILFSAHLALGHLAPPEVSVECSEWPVTASRSGKSITVHLSPVETAVDAIERASSYGTVRWPGLLAAATWAASHGIERLHFSEFGPGQPGLPLWGAISEAGAPAKE